MSVFSYGMMPPKQWKENQMSVQKRCPECNCDFEKVQCDCAFKINAGTYKDSLLVEQDVNRCDCELKITHLKTKSELMAEFENDAEVIRKHFKSECNTVGIDERGEYFSFFLKNTITGDEILGRTFKYRPDPVAPVKWEPVFFTGKFGVIQRGFSLGVLAHDGLRISFGGIAISCERWCSVNNRDHRSPGWRKEWEPSE